MNNFVVIPLIQIEKGPYYQTCNVTILNNAVEKRGKESWRKKGAATGSISETVFHRETVPGVPGIYMVEGWVYLSEMRLPPWISAIQRTVPMRQMLTTDLNDSGNRAIQAPYAPDIVVSGGLSDVSG